MAYLSILLIPTNKGIKVYRTSTKAYTGQQLVWYGVDTYHAILSIWKQGEGWGEGGEREGEGKGGREEGERRKRSEPSKPALNSNPSFPKPNPKSIRTHKNPLQRNSRIPSFSSPQGNPPWINLSIDINAIAVLPSPLLIEIKEKNNKREMGIKDMKP